mmetsp:Transcript_8211/g.16492  ORF Transcript_8211/g.16492 Transcript_8211/m.16492 type:complete len:138 (+) Transcript_8211:120-533(+)
MMRMTMTTMVNVAILLVGLWSLFAENTIDAWVVPPLSTRRTIGYHQPSQQRATTSATYRTTPAATTALLASYRNSTEATASEESPPLEKPKKGYVRVEEWNAQHKASLEWEEKVKFDGTRHGNRWQQNEILRQNLFK